MKNKLKLFAAGATATAAMVGQSQAQSVDALLDKLVDKGILTVKDANELREESDKNFNTALQAKFGMPDWVQTLKFSGDMRGRFENFSSDNSTFVERNRFRYRFRFGVTVGFLDDFEAGLRLTSSEANSSFGGDSISGNTTFQDNGSKKFIYIDQAYGKWTPFKGPNVTGGFTVGKMENPFVFSDMVFDADYTPEGFATQLAYRFNDKHTARLNAGAFVIDEISGLGTDPYMLGVQMRWDASWTPKFQTSLGAAWLMLEGENFLSNGSLPNVNRGNTREVVVVNSGTPFAATNMSPAATFAPFVLDASATYFLTKAPFYAGPFPIKVSADYINNCASSGGTDKYGYSFGVTFGKSGKKKTWELGYTYKWLGADAWWEELVDSDFGGYYAGVLPNSGTSAGYGSGTNVKGHIVRFAWSPSDVFTFGVKWFLTELINEVPTGSKNEMSRLQVDASWKF